MLISSMEGSRLGAPDGANEGISVGLPDGEVKGETDGIFERKIECSAVGDVIMILYGVG